ncbi:MAG: hypothetical protein EBU49_08710 [Proteobacteria bacterium]|nr:hypothetical protein [Pseudomonadota bacterium]
MIRMSINSGVMFIALGTGLIACKPAVSGNLKSEDEIDQVNLQAEQENGPVNPEAGNSADLQPIQDYCYTNTSSSADSCQAQLAAAKASRTYTEYWNNVVPYGSTQPSFVGPGVGYSSPHISYAERDNRERLSEQEYLNRCIADAQEIYRCKFLSCMLQKVPVSQRQSFEPEYDQRQCRRLF